jgi:hypothetical protein
MKQSVKVEPSQLKNLEREFLAFLQDVSLRDRADKEKPLIYLGRCYGRNCANLQWGIAPLTRARDAAQKLCPNVSGKRISNTLRDLMIKMFEDQTASADADPEMDADLESIVEILDTSNVQQELAEVIELLKSQARSQMVFVPIEGLDLKTSNLTIGAVELHNRHSTSELDNALRSLEERMGRKLTSRWDDLENATCYAKVKVTGDDYFVWDEAVRQVKKAIHILNLYLSSSRHQPYWASIRVARVIVNRTVPTDDSEDDLIGSNHSFPRDGRSFELDWKAKQLMSERGLKELNAHFDPKNNNEIAKRVRRAVTWYGKAVDADSPEEKFVNLAIALESLLIGDEGKGRYVTTGSITQTLRERVAFLLVDDFESRVQMSKMTRDLYGLRSGIVHGGKPIGQQELANMDYLVAQVTVAFLTAIPIMTNRFTP